MRHKETTINEDRSLSANINLYYDLRSPSVTPAPLLIALHGYGANKRQMMREGQLMAPDNFALASLQAFHQHMREPKERGGPFRFGFGWITNYHPEESIAVHHKALLDLIENLTTESIADPERIFLLGFSQSCALNYRFAFTHTDMLRGIVGICGGIPGDWESNDNYRPTQADVFHLAGTRDDFYTPQRVGDYKEQLATRARSVEFRSYDAAHEITGDMRKDVKQFLLKQS
jgi:phospholipase/carboxylesterase